jgi:hypothetical protein
MCRTKITVQSGAQRHPKDASAASALDGDLGRLKTVAPGRMAVPARARSAGVAAAGRGRAAPGERSGGSPPCAAGAKAELPVRPRRVSRGRLRPPRRARHSSLRPPRARHLASDHAPDGVRRAPRALEDVKKVVTHRTTPVV